MRLRSRGMKQQYLRFQPGFAPNRCQIPTAGTATYRGARRTACGSGCSDTKPTRKAR